MEIVLSILTSEIKVVLIEFLNVNYRRDALMLMNDDLILVRINIHLGMYVAYM